MIAQDDRGLAGSGIGQATDARTLDERVLHAEKVEAVGRLAAGIAHDFNNLLTAILGFSELLLARHSDPADPDRGDLEQMQHAGQRAAALTQQLLAYSRKQVLRPREIDLNVVVRDLRGFVSRLIREDISLMIELDAEPAVVRVDPGQIEQALMNLVLNARDALPAGGCIRISVDRVPGAAIDAATDALEYIRVRVADNGAGMEPSVKARVFEPFFTTKEVGQGSGLGLASVDGIVRQSNGLITVDSEVGSGSTFTILLPAILSEAAVAAHAPIAPPAPLANPAGRRQTILLVEDEDSVRDIVSTALRQAGHEVLEASHPSRACELFAERGSSVDMLLSDIVMPGMSGPALAQRLLAAKPSLRVLFMSGYSGVALMVGAGNPNVSFLSKPFRASTLVATVCETLARRGSWADTRSV